MSEKWRETWEKRFKEFEDEYPDTGLELLKPKLSGKIRLDRYRRKALDIIIDFDITKNGMKSNQ